MTTHTVPMAELEVGLSRAGVHNANRCFTDRKEALAFARDIRKRGGVATTKKVSFEGLGYSVAWFVEWKEVA